MVPSLVQPRPHPTHGMLWNPVELYTLPYVAPKDGSGTNAAVPTPLPTLQATAAACEADAACGMFTSDGYIVGAYRRTLPAGNKEQVGSEADILLWQPMHHCTWACCGTWVAEGLFQHLLQPVPQMPGANSVRTITESKLPSDGVKQYQLNPELRTTACVGKPAPRTPVLGNTPASPPGSPGCPQRCLAACCKQLESGEATMGAFFFSQCSGEVCQLCGFAKSVVAAWSPVNVLMRQYVREQSSKGPAAAANASKQGLTKCAPGGSGGSAQAASGQLC